MTTGQPESATNDIPLKESIIADLQSRVAFQEDTLQTLNQVIADQDAGIRHLQKQIQLLNKKLNDIASNIGQGGSSESEEAPPHY